MTPRRWPAHDRKKSFRALIPHRCTPRRAQRILTQQTVRAEPPQRRTDDVRDLPRGQMRELRKDGQALLQRNPQRRRCRQARLQQDRPPGPQYVYMAVVPGQRGYSGSHFWTPSALSRAIAHSYRGRHNTLPPPRVTASSTRARAHCVRRPAGCRARRRRRRRRAFRAPSRTGGALPVGYGGAPRFGLPVATEQERTLSRSVAAA